MTTQAENFADDIRIYVDCMTKIGGRTGTIEFYVQVYVIPDLSVDLVIGMDAISAYGIDTLISKSIASVSIDSGELHLPIEFRPPSNGNRHPNSQASFLVFAAQDVSIPDMYEAMIDVIIWIQLPPDCDAWFTPWIVRDDTSTFAPLNGACIPPGPVSSRQKVALWQLLKSEDKDEEGTTDWET